MITFKCSSCEKELSLQDRIYEKAYKDHDTCLDCRPKHGGYREGAGRPSLGVTKKVSITLPDNVWDEIEHEKGELTMSAFLRGLVLNRSKGEES
jgi:hypothetical protein